jgi:hypothetical protein
MSQNTQQCTNTAQKAKALKEEKQHHMYLSFAARLTTKKIHTSSQSLSKRSCLTNFHHCKQLQQSPNEWQKCGDIWVSVSFAMPQYKHIQT